MFMQEINWSFQLHFMDFRKQPINYLGISLPLRRACLLKQVLRLSLLILTVNSVTTVALASFSFRCIVLHKKSTPLTILVPPKSLTDV